MMLPREEETELLKWLSSKVALALIGPRRVGKSTLARRMLELWKARGGDGAYFDFEMVDAPTQAKQLVAKLAVLPKRNFMLVFDEVQALEGWIKVVRQEIEYGSRKVIVTGSSASLLSKEVASSLAGRAVPKTIFPLSYSDVRIWGLKTLDEYLALGGYPECVLRPFNARELHKLYLELAILRDVAARQGIREIKPLSDLALIILSEPGKVISSRKTAERLGISQPTFRSFVQALNDAFLVLSVAPYLRSPREKIIADSKHYAYDVGLQNSVSISTSKDRGRCFENIVAIELLRRGYSLSYAKGEDWECDFIAQKLGCETLAIQVFTGEQLPERELRGLSEGMKLAKAKGMFLTLNRFSVSHKEKAFQVKKIEDWLLHPSEKV